MEENRMSDLFASSLEGLRGIAETSSVTGQPITTPSGTTIIPVSKMSLGFAGGSSDYASDKDKSGKKNFGGGGGYSGATATPVGFLIVTPEGDVKFISVDTPAGDGVTLSELTEKLPKLFAKIKEAVEKKKSEKAAKKAAENEEQSEDESAKTAEPEKSDE